MAILRRSNGASKHVLPDMLKDPALEAKCVIESIRKLASIPDDDTKPQC